MEFFPPPKDVTVNQILPNLRHGTSKLAIYRNFTRQEYVFSSLYRSVLAVASRIRTYLRAGDRVGVMSENSIDYVIVDLACIAAGVCSISIDNQTKLDEHYLMYLKHLNTQLLVLNNSTREETCSTYHYPVIRYTDLIDETQISSTAPAESQPFDIEPHSWAEDAPLTIKQTSGSTGVPKAIGACISSINDTLSIIQNLFNHKHNDSLLIFLPLSLLQQRSWIYSAILFGYDIVLTDFKYVFDVLSKAKPTVIMGVPVFFEALRARIEYKAKVLPAPGNTEFSQLSSAATAVVGQNIRYMWTGSAPCRIDTLEFFFKLNLPLFEGYGTNETDIISKNCFEHFRLGSVGKVLPNRYISFDKNRQIIVEKTYPVSLGYEFNAQSSSGFIDGHRFMTGDCGYLDKDGYLYITGRVNDLIVLDNGTSINPVEIESQLERLPSVKHAVVYGNNKPYLISIIDPSNRHIDRKDIEKDVRSMCDALNSSKRIRNIIITSQCFSQENGCLSSQHKIRREHILKLYEEDIRLCYTT